MKTEALIEFICDTSHEDIELIHEYLKSEGIDYKPAMEELKQWLKEKEAEQKIKTAGKLQMLYEKIKADGLYKQAALKESDFVFAARNMKDLSEEDRQFLIDNISILKEMEREE